MPFANWAGAFGKPLVDAAEGYTRALVQGPDDADHQADLAEKQAARPLVREKARLVNEELQAKAARERLPKVQALNKSHYAVSDASTGQVTVYAYEPGSDTGPRPVGTLKEFKDTLAAEVAAHPEYMNDPEKRALYDAFISRAPWVIGPPGGTAVPKSDLYGQTLRSGQSQPQAQATPELQSKETPGLTESYAQRFKAMPQPEALAIVERYLQQDPTMASPATQGIVQGYQRAFPEASAQLRIGAPTPSSTAPSTTTPLPAPSSTPTPSALPPPAARPLTGYQFPQSPQQLQAERDRQEALRRSQEALELQRQEAQRRAATDARQAAIGASTPERTNTAAILFKEGKIKSAEFDKLDAADRATVAIRMAEKDEGSRRATEERLRNEEQRLDLAERRFQHTEDQAYIKNEKDAMKAVEPHYAELRALDTSKALTEAIVPLINKATVGVGGFGTGIWQLMSLLPGVGSAYETNARNKVIAADQKMDALVPGLRQKIDKVQVDAQLAADIESDAPEARSLIFQPGRSRLQTLVGILTYVHALAVKRSGGGSAGRGINKQDIENAEHLFSVEKFLRTPDQAFESLQALQFYIQKARPKIEEAISVYHVDPKTHKYVQPRMPRAAVPQAPVKSYTTTAPRGGESERDPAEELLDSVGPRPGEIP